MAEPPYRKRGPTARPYETLPGFEERYPGVWMPRNYVPSEHEFPTPIPKTPEEVAAEYVRCANSLSYFVFSACWSLHTDDPGGDPIYRKFPTYPYLRHFFKSVQRPQNLHLEKSRQMLMSWAWMSVFLWDILFHHAWGNLAVSETEKKVDDGAWNSTTDSLFGKLRVLWTSLPPYLQHPIEMTHLYVRCPETGSYIKGVSGQTGGGRGASYKRALLDEAAHIKRGESLFRGVKEAAKTGLILNSTPLGKGNVFARMRFQPNTTFQMISYHWTMHPEKAKGLYCTCGWQSTDPTGRTNIDEWTAHTCPVRDDSLDPIARHARSPWYDKATSDYTPEQIASEFDLSYEASMRGRVFDAFDARIHIRNHQDLVLPDGSLLGPIGDHELSTTYRKRYLQAVLQPDLPVVCGWDFGVGDPTYICLGQVLDDSTFTIRWIDEFSATDKGYDFFQAFINGLWKPIVKECTGLDILHYGDPAGKQRASDLMSWITNLKAHPDPQQRIHIIYGPKVGSKLEWLDFIRTVIRKNNIEVMSYVTMLADAYGQYHFPLDVDGNPIPGAHEPVHDQWSHPADAQRYVYAFRYSPSLPNIANSGPTRISLLTEPNEKRGIDRIPAQW